MSKKLLAVGAMAAALCALPAAASAATTHISFFSGGTSSVAWENFTPAAPGSTEPQSIKLQVHATSASDFDDFAGVQLLGVAGAAPATAPSYDFISNQTGGSGGSPRLVMEFSDGGDMELRPLSLTAGSWVHESGASNDWDNHGGSCGFLFETSYPAALACHTGATVTAVFAVNDSGWLYPGSDLTFHLDNIAYGSALIYRQVPTSLAASPAVAQIAPGLGINIGNLKGTLTEAGGAPIAGATIVFSAGGSTLCSATTNATGVATCSGLAQSLGAILHLGYIASFGGDATYAPSSGHGSIVTIGGLSL